MRFLPLLSVLIPIFGLLGADTSLQTVLARMDTVSAKFHGLRADVKQVAHTEIVQSDEVEIGKIVVRRPSPKDLRMRVELQGANARMVSFLGTKAQMYYPKMNTVQEYTLGKFSKFKDQLFTLGFGSTSKDLEAAYSLQLGGPDIVAGHPATRIVLLPKEQQMRSMFPKIELWVLDSGFVAQQKLYETGGDYLMATYTNMEQANVTDADVKLNVPKNAKWETPQK